jgi:hypothetical protein
MIVASPILAGPNNENGEVSGRWQKVVSGLGPGDRDFCCLNMPLSCINRISGSAQYGPK